MTKMSITMEEYNEKEEATFRKDLFRRMDVQDEALNRIETQTIRTNGRVTAVEIQLKDYEGFKTAVNNLSGFKMWLSGAVAVLLFLGSGIGFFFSYYIRTNTESTVRDILKEEKPVIIRDTISEIDRTYNLGVKE